MHMPRERICSHLLVHSERGREGGREEGREGEEEEVEVEEEEISLLTPPRWLPTA